MHLTLRECSLLGFHESMVKCKGVLLKSSLSHKCEECPLPYVCVQIFTDHKLTICAKQHKFVKIDFHACVTGMQLGEAIAIIDNVDLIKSWTSREAMEAICPGTASPSCVRAMCTGNCHIIYSDAC